MVFLVLGLRITRVKRTDTKQIFRAVDGADFMQQEEQLSWTVGKLILGVLAVAFFLMATIHAQGQVGEPNRAASHGYHFEKVIQNP
jgi:hypothetical protein